VLVRPPPAPVPPDAELRPAAVAVPAEIRVNISIAAKVRMNLREHARSRERTCSIASRYSRRATNQTLTKSLSHHVRPKVTRPALPALFNRVGNRSDENRRATSSRQDPALAFPSVALTPTAPRQQIARRVVHANPLPMVKVWRQGSPVSPAHPAPRRRGLRPPAKRGSRAERHSVQRSISAVVVGGQLASAPKNSLKL
jgi:hypothetical protein